MQRGKSKLTNIATRMMMLFCVVSGALAQTPDPASAPDGVDVAASPAIISGSPLEQAIARRREQAHFDAEILWLDASTGPFLALHRPADEAVPFGALVIYSTPGSVVDDAPALLALAREAATGGWSVLSLQPASAAAGPAAASDRIAAAVTYFTGTGLHNIVIASDGGGASVTLAAIAEQGSPALVGFVGIGAWDADLADVGVPILDLAGTRDRRAMQWQSRRQARARDYPGSIEAMLIDGAGPRFRGYAAHAAKRVRGWLKRAAPATVVSR